MKVIVKFKIRNVKINIFILYLLLFFVVVFCKIMKIYVNIRTKKFLEYHNYKKLGSIGEFFEGKFMSFI